ncbi:MAG: DUF2179 domain-containing protein [Metamycoplasmataceae bacterium]
MKKNDQNKPDFNRVNIKDSILKFSFLHRVEKLWLQVLLTIVIAVIFSFIAMLLIQNTGLYGFGVDAISHGFGRLFGFLTWHFSKNKNLSRYIFIIFFWLVNFLINIPLFFFAYKKINKNFTLLNFIFMLFSTIAGIGFGFIKGSENWTFFGNSINENLAKDTNNIVQSLFWQNDDDYKMYFLVFIYGILWAIIQGIFAAALLILNSSTAGFDILVVWYTQKKIVNLGYIYTIFHIACLLFANTIGTYIPASISPNTPQNWEFKVFFNPNLISSLIMILLNGVIIDIIFPKYKIVKMEIFTNQIEQIRKEIYEIPHKRFQMSIINTTGGFSNKEGKLIVIKCFYTDTPDIIKIIEAYDPNAFVSIIDISKTFGYMFVSQSNSLTK